MGQAPDLVRDPDDRSEDVNFGTFNTGQPTPSTTTDDPEVIRNQIENTRADMTETIDAIQERLNPDTLKEHAKDAVREATVGRAEEAVSNVSERAQEMVHDVTDTARDAGTGVVDLVRQNPLPAALAGIGLGWLWMNRSKSQHTQRSYYQPQRHTTMHQQSYYSPGFQEYERREARYQPQGQSQSVGDRVGNVAGSVGDAAGNAAETVQHTAGQVAGQVGQFGSMAQDEMQDLRYKADRMLDENPIPVGFLALGLGLAVGMMIPETQKENQVFGEARETVVDRAQSAAHEVVEKVQNVVGDVAESAQQAAQEQGLTSS